MSRPVHLYHLRILKDVVLFFCKKKQRFLAKICNFRHFEIYKFLCCILVV